MQSTIKSVKSIFANKLVDFFENVSDVEVFVIVQKDFNNILILYFYFKFHISLLCFILVSYIINSHCSSFFYQNY